MTGSTHDPIDSYLTDGAPEQGYGWSVPAAQSPQAAPMVPYQQIPPYRPPQVDEQLNARQERRMVTLRMVIALTAAIPITGILASAFDNSSSLVRLMAVVIGWAGIGAIVWLSQGRSAR